MTDRQYIARTLMWGTGLLVAMLIILKVEPVPSFIDNHLGTDAKTGVVAFINLVVFVWIYFSGKRRVQAKKLEEKKTVFIQPRRKE